MGTVDAGTIEGSGRVKFNTTVHGPVTGYAKVGGKTVAVSRKRASYGQDILWQLGFRDLTTGKVKSAATLRDAMATSPFTFNVGYADDRDIAMYSAGKLPKRDPRVDPRLPTKGTGEYEWKGFLSKAQHPFQVNPPSGTLVNWNNRPAPKWGAADDNWSYGSVQRVRMLNDGLAKAQTHTPATVTSAMNAAATQDLRSVALTPVISELLKAAPSPSPRATRMLAILNEWRAAGSSRLDRDLDGRIDAGPGPAIWDAFYPRLFAAAMPIRGLGPYIGTDSGTAGDFTDGGFWYLEKDLRTINEDKVRRKFNARVLRGREPGEVRRGGLEGARRRPRRPRRAERRREQGADRVPARAAPDHDPLHQPSERDPAGDLVRRPPAALTRGARLDGARYGRICSTTPKTTQVAAGVPRPSWRTPPVMIAFWERRSMWNVNVFDPPMAIDVAVWLAATDSAPSPLPTRRATLTISPEALLNAIVEIGSSLPAAVFWSLQVAVSVPRPLSVGDRLRRARRVVGDLEDVAEHGRLGDVGDELAGQAALVQRPSGWWRRACPRPATARRRRRPRSCRRRSPRARRS